MHVYLTRQVPPRPSPILRDFLTRYFGQSEWQQIVNQSILRVALEVEELDYPYARRQRLMELAARLLPLESYGFMSGWLPIPVGVFLTVYVYPEFVLWMSANVCRHLHLGTLAGVGVFLALLLSTIMMSAGMVEALWRLLSYRHLQRLINELMDSQARDPLALRDDLVEIGHIAPTQTNQGLIQPLLAAINACEHRHP